LTGALHSCRGGRMPRTNVTSKTFQLSLRAPHDIVERINRYAKRLSAASGVELSQAQVVLALLTRGLITVEKLHTKGGSR
jgi:hypothetical protein